MQPIANLKSNVAVVGVEEASREKNAADMLPEAAARQLSAWAELLQRNLVRRADLPVQRREDEAA